MRHGSPGNPSPLTGPFDITANQGSAIIMMYNASVAANSEKSGAAFDRIVHYVNIWEKAFRLNMQSIVDEEQLQQVADLLGNGVVPRMKSISAGVRICLTLSRVRIFPAIPERQCRTVAHVPGPQRQREHDGGEVCSWPTH
jgi:hypothetical protein